MKKLLILITTMMAGIFAAFADSPAEYPGGKEAMDKFIQSNMIYPSHAKEFGIEGVVPVQFNVKADGSIGSIKIVRMIDPDLEQEAIRLVKTMPAWTPAVVNGKPADSTARVDIEFRIPAETPPAEEQK